MWSWRRRRVGPLVALVFVVGLVAGCGGSGPPTSDAADSGTSSDSTVDGSGTTGGDGSTDGGGTTGGGSSDEPLAWVPFGPSDPNVPTPSWPTYRAFAKGDCSALQTYLDREDAADVGELGKAMVAVCAAAVEGRQDQWEVGATALAAAAGSLANDCLEPVVRELLARALDWHQRNPGRKPDVRFQTVGGDGKTPCAGDTDPTVTEPSVTEPSVTEPTVTDPTVTDPTETTG